MSNWLEKISNDVMILPSFEQKVKGLSNKEIINLYQNVTDFKIYSWAFNCLLAYELHRREYSFQKIAKELNCTRQTCWREAQIYKEIISKAPELLNEPYLSKTWFKRIIEKKVEDPIAELWKIAKEREEISLGNIERKQKGLPTVKQLSTRAYANKERVYTCDVCGESVKKFYKICENCLGEVK